MRQPDPAPSDLDLVAHRGSHVSSCRSGRRYGPLVDPSTSVKTNVTVPEGSSRDTGFMMPQSVTVFKSGSDGTRTSKPRAKAAAKPPVLARGDEETARRRRQPATSGVIGRFEGRDDWRRLTRNHSIHAALRASAVRFRMVERKGESLAAAGEAAAGSMWPGTEATARPCSSSARAWDVAKPALDKRRGAAPDISGAPTRRPARAARAGR